MTHHFLHELGAHFALGHGLVARVELLQAEHILGAKATHRPSSPSRPARPVSGNKFSMLGDVVMDDQSARRGLSTPMPKAMVATMTSISSIRNWSGLAAHLGRPVRRDRGRLDAVDGQELGDVLGGFAALHVDDARLPRIPLMISMICLRSAPFSLGRIS